MGTLKVDGHIEGNYIKSQWLYTSAATALTSAAKIACIGSDDYIYYIAPANMSVGQADKLDGYHADSFLLKSGGTMTGAITMSESTGFAMAFAQKSNNPWIYPKDYPEFGIRYFEGDPDKMTFSASGNNTSISGADLCINGNGEGTVTIRGNTILHAGNYSSYTVTKTGSGASGTWNISIYGNAATSSQCNGVIPEWAGSVAWADTGWIAAWNSDGTKIKALNKSSFAPASHTHNYLPLSGGTMLGDICINTYGVAGKIRWYKDSYTTWINYMSPPDSNHLTPGGGIPSEYGNVTSWALRSTIENNSGYGWIWDGIAEGSSATPSPKMALSSCTGDLWVAGDVHTNANIIINNGGWYYTYGASGWYNATYDGGWYMSDTSWVTSYAGKGVYTSGQMKADGGFVGTVTNLLNWTTTTTNGTALDNATTNGVWYVNDIGGLFGQSDGVCWAQGYNSSWITQIFQDYRTGQIAVRGKNNGTWMPWRTCLYGNSGPLSDMPSGSYVGQVYLAY